CHVRSCSGSGLGGTDEKVGRVSDICGSRLPAPPRHVRFAPKQRAGPALVQKASDFLPLHLIRATQARLAPGGKRALAARGCLRFARRRELQCGLIAAIRADVKAQHAIALSQQWRYPAILPPEALEETSWQSAQLRGRLHETTAISRHWN